MKSLTFCKTFELFSVHPHLGSLLPIILNKEDLTAKVMPASIAHLCIHWYLTAGCVNNLEEIRIKPRSLQAVEMIWKKYI